MSLSINPESTSPGEEVLVRVNASQDSFVSLSAIDQSVLLLSAGNEINSEMVVFTIFCNYLIKLLLLNHLSHNLRIT